MFGISYAKWKWIVGLLILANIAYYFYDGWGLVTVKVHDEPLSKVISSIEWQGWVRIYTNLPPDTTVTMYVDHVPLAEAMKVGADVGATVNAAVLEDPAVEYPVKVPVIVSFPTGALVALHCPLVVEPSRSSTRGAVVHSATEPSEKATVPRAKRPSTAVTMAE